MWPPLFTSVTAEGYRGILFVLTLIARSGQQKLGNPTAIATRVIDGTGTDRETETPRQGERERGEIGRSLLLCPSLSLSLNVQERKITDINLMDIEPLGRV